jgi:asparagine synthase (glutamine-hydrolysing)
MRQLPNHLLAKVDRSTMSESIEGRVPYLDKNLVEFILNLDDSYMIPKNKYLALPDAKTTKPLLRDYAAKNFGTSLANRPKKGFMLPLDSMIKASKSEIIDLIDSRNFIFNSSEKNRIINLVNRLKKNKNITVADNWYLWRVYIIQKVLNVN